jgi:4-amino-4-deoxy-L-arabinose transferase
MGTSVMGSFVGPMRAGDISMEQDRPGTPRNARIMAALLVVVFPALYIAPLGVRPLVIPDETRYAEIAREMLASGDWIVPRLNGLRYFEKPVLGHWLNAGSIRLFGENAFAVRFPSAVATGLTALLLLAWARRFPDSTPGAPRDNVIPLLAVTVFLLSFEVFALGVFCLLDSLLSLFVTAAIVLLYFAYDEQTARARMVLLIAAGLACGLAFLTKGFLAMAIPVVVIVPFALCQGRLGTCLRTAWVPLVVAGLTVLPWGVLVHRREPDFWHYFFWVEHVQRFVSPEKGQHPFPFWFYVPVLLGGAMPWTPLAGTIVQGVRYVGLRSPMIRLAICWLGMPFLLFSIASGKLGTYILPCFPPLAFLIAVGLLECLRRDDATAFVIGAWVCVVGTVVFGLALIAGLIALPDLSAAAAMWKWIVVIAGLLLWSLLAHAAIKKTPMRLVFYCAAPVLFMTTWHVITPALSHPKKMPVEFLVANASRIPADGILVTSNNIAAAVCWSWKRDDILLVGSSGEYRYGLNYEDSKHRLLTAKQLKDLVEDSAGKRPVILCTNAEQYDEYAATLPKPGWQIAGRGLVLAQFTSACADPNRCVSP